MELGNYLYIYINILVLVLATKQLTYNVDESLLLLLLLVESTARRFFGVHV